jgi:transposase-like protein
MHRYPTTSRSWAPPFCPNPNCQHHSELATPWPYKKIGSFRRHQPPFRIQRFLCLTCRRSFSTQTFSTTYWQKRPDLDAAIVTKTVGCMANRQIARDLGVAPETVNRHIARLGRHCMLFHLRMIHDLPPPTEIVVDGFESFEWSQYFPIHHHVAVGKGDDFFYYFTDSPLRRKGRMTKAQRRRRELLEKVHGRPDPQAIEKDMRHLLEVVFRGRSTACVLSDDHPAYVRSIRGLDKAIDHRTTPGSDHRDQHNPLWEVNLLDLLIRHSSANHKRETIAWSKRRQASAERLAILLVWRNYMKGRREKARGSPTPAMELGLLDHRLSVGELLRGRLFRSRVDVPERWGEYYDRSVRTLVMARQRRHGLSYGY